jgi:pyruvate dehydrogenase E1 component alpha subunit
LKGSVPMSGRTPTARGAIAAPSPAPGGPLDPPAPLPVVPLRYDREELPHLLGEGWESLLKEMYRGMLLGRVLDTRMLGLQRQGRVGFYGPATGQEASSVGCALALAKDDWIFPGLREQLIALIRGLDLTLYLHHLFANDLDTARGRQMPCHPSAREVHYVSMSSNIGTQIVQAVGLGYALHLRKEPVISTAFFGDGATSSNDFHAGMNFAGVWQLPVLFVCTNNQWAISVPQEKQTASSTYAEKAQAYGFPGTRVDGTDVIAVYRAVREARATILGGGGPRMIEMVLYRLTPHSSSDDPSRYQPRGWMEQAKAHDPLGRFELLLDALGVLPAAAREEMRGELDAKVRAAIQEAEVMPPPRSESLFDDTVKTPGWPLTEERESFDKEQGGNFP